MKHYTKKDIFKIFKGMFFAASLISVVFAAGGILIAEFFTAGLTANIMTIAIISTAFIIVIAVCYIAGYLLTKHFSEITAFYVSVLDSIPTPIVVTGLDMNNIFINKAAEEVCEVSRAKFTGVHFDKLWDENICKRGVETLKTGKPWTLCRYKDKNYQLSSAYLYDDALAETGYVEVLQDISQTENILGAIDASVVITDMETDEVIFMSEAFRKIKNIGSERCTGEKCYNVLYGLDERCPNCEKEKLMKAPEAQIEKEAFDPITNRHYKAIDSLAKWTLGANVHTHRLIDITDRKMDSAFMKRRLEQQELMTTISLAFFSNSNIRDSIVNSLKLTGEFLGASRIALVKHESEHQILRIESEWTNNANNMGEYLQILSFSPLDGMYIELINHKKKFVIGYSHLDADMFPEIFKTGVDTFISVPLYIFDSLWGVAGIEYIGEHKWDRSDISLALFIGNILSGFLRREKTEADLMRMSSIANNSPQFISYTDLRGNYLFINNGASDVAGYDYHEIKEGGLRLLHGEEMAKKIVDEYFPKVMEHGKLSFETPFYIKDGGTRMLNVSAFFIPDLESGIGMIASDITEQRNLENDLTAAKEAAEAANIAKSEFLYRMSHEIRTPMTSIIGMTDIAKTTKNFAQISYCLEQVENASKYLLGVINDLLDMSKIEANKLEMTYDDLDLAMLIRRVTGMFGFLIDKSRLNLTVTIDDEIPSIIISDKLRISQILTNLLSNAVRFTPEDGDISLNAGILSKTADECSIKIEVTDCGIGEASETDEPMFDNLDDAGGHILQKYAGTRIGLSMAKRIAHLMGGELTYTSEPSTGTVITFVFRAKIGSQLELGTSAGTDLLGDISIDGRYEGKRVLLAEDVDLNCDIFAALLSATGIEIDYAQNGIEACAMVRDSQSKRYDCIVMDLHMPEMNGLEATKIIREMDSPYAKVVPIIAFTADVFKEDIDKCLETGMNSHIAKPINFSEMIKTLDDYLK